MGYFGCGMVLTCSTGYGIADNSNKRHIFFFFFFFFCPGLIFKTISVPLDHYTENAIFRIFIQILFPVEFKSFSVFLIKRVMKVTCRLKSAEKVYSRKSYAPKFDFGIFSQKKKIHMT